MPSSAVRDIEYDPASETLWVTFVPTGKRYAYRFVPVAVYEAFIHAFSKAPSSTASSATSTTTARWERSESPSLLRLTRCARKSRFSPTRGERDD